MAIYMITMGELVDTSVISVIERKNINMMRQGRPLQPGRVINQRANRWVRPVSAIALLSRKQATTNGTMTLPQVAENSPLAEVTPVKPYIPTHSRLAQPVPTVTQRKIVLRNTPRTPMPSLVIGGAGGNTN